MHTQVEKLVRVCRQPLGREGTQVAMGAQQRAVPVQAQGGGSGMVPALLVGTGRHRRESGLGDTWS